MWLRSQGQSRRGGSFTARAGRTGFDEGARRSGTWEAKNGAPARDGAGGGAGRSSGGYRRRPPGKRPGRFLPPRQAGGAASGSAKPESIQRAQVRRRRQGGPRRGARGVGPDGEAPGAPWRAAWARRVEEGVREGARRASTSRASPRPGGSRARRGRGRGHMLGEPLQLARLLLGKAQAFRGLLAAKRRQAPQGVEGEARLPSMCTSGPRRPSPARRGREPEPGDPHGRHGWGRVGDGEEAEHLVADPLRARGCRGRRGCGRPRPGRRGRGPPRGRRLGVEAEVAQGAQVVLADAGAGVADEANVAEREVGEAAGGI
jgi:hypothetical protein